MDERNSRLKKAKEELEAFYSTVQDAAAKKFIRNSLDKIYEGWDEDTALIEKMEMEIKKLREK